MQDRFKDIFKRRLENAEAEPAPGDWERLEAELDRLASQRAKNIYRYLAASLTLFGLAALIIMLLFSPYLEDWSRGRSSARLATEIRKETDYNNLSRNTLRNHRIIKDDNMSDEAISATGFRSVKKQRDPGLKQSTTVPFLPGNRNGIAEKGDAGPGSLTEADMLRGILLRYLEYSFDRTDGAEMDRLYERFLAGGDKTEILEMLKSMPIIPRGFYLGISGSVNSIWIAYQNTYNDFYGSELAYVPDFGYAWGFSAGYNLSDRIGLQAEWLVRAQQGQQYEDIIRTRPVRRTIDLTYTQFPVVLKYKFSKLGRSGKTPVSQNVLLGGYFGLLHSATITTNNDPVPATGRFRKEDVGIVMGMEYDIYMSPRAALSIGSRCKLGMKEINAPAWQQNKQDPNKSINLSVGIQARLQMIFPGKTASSDNEPRPFN